MPSLIRLAAAFAILLCGACGSPPPTSPPLPTSPVTELVGELHLHQFPLGAHAWAAFVPAPVSVAEVHTDELVELTTLPTGAEGSCLLYGQPHCTPECGATSYCMAPNVCVPIKPLIYIDGGPISVSGSDVTPHIELHFTGGDTGYAATPEPGPTPLFAGGETLHVQGGGGATTLGGDLIAPLPVRVTMPDLTQPLHFSSGTTYPVRWAAAGGEQMIVSLLASTQTAAATIRCVTSDSGALDIAASLMSALPPPPRSIRIEVERDYQRLLKTLTPGRGVLAHAAFSTWENGND